MPIYYIQYEAKPTSKSELFDNCGGAFVNCWVNSESKATAKEIAMDAIRNNNWKIVSVEEECREAIEKYYAEDQEGMEYYKQAVTDGECYVYHQWPNESQEEEDVH